MREKVDKRGIIPENPSDVGGSPDELNQADPKLPTDIWTSLWETQRTDPQSLTQTSNAQNRKLNRWYFSSHRPSVVTQQYLAAMNGSEKLERISSISHSKPRVCDKGLVTPCLAWWSHPLYQWAWITLDCTNSGRWSPCILCEYSGCSLEDGFKETRLEERKAQWGGC